LRPLKNGAKTASARRPLHKEGTAMRVLVVDVGGTNVKLLASGQRVPRKFPSGRRLTPKKMVEGVIELAAGWDYDAIAIGYPGRVRNGRIVVEPKNLGRGWIGFNFRAAFGRPVRILNDAAMQALGSYKRGLMLFLGFGTSLGAAVVVDGVVLPLELAHLSFKDGTYQDYVGDGALRRLGRKKWQKHVEYGAARMIEAVGPDDVVFGGGNVKKLKGLPKGCRAGANANAFVGGYRLWGATR
jgi:polyphosphate glucokinase